MAVLTVRNLPDDTVRRLRVRAAENGRSAEAEHRAILQEALTKRDALATRHEAARRLAEFRDRTGGRDCPSSVALLREVRDARTAKLAGIGLED